MMILNTTFHLDDEIHAEALDYLKTVYIPGAIKSGKAAEARLRKVLGSGDEDGHSYSLQFSIADLDALKEWNAQTGRMLNAKLIERFSDKVIGFSTLLQEMEL
ncbi:MAG: DUF4286 family protein [Dysgonamonadaceae bacterium]|jgi:hypothetical protein|nr:DUF4286 family protein [Dysgonamonadaceae bacterium]